MASDFRVPLDPILEAFGVPVTVIRPAPDQTPITTTGVWLSPRFDEERVGSDFTKREPRRVMALPRSDIPPPLPRQTLILASEVSGGTIRTWRVDGFDEVQSDEWRPILMPQ